MKQDSGAQRSNSAENLHKASAELRIRFAYCVSKMLEYGGVTYDKNTQDAAEMLSQALHAAPERYSAIEKGRALAGMVKLAMGTHEEGPALENAGRVSGLNRALGAVVYSLSAIHGPSDNLYLVSEGLYLIDRKLTASILVEVAQHDPSDHVRRSALKWLDERFSGKSDFIEDIGFVSMISQDEQQVVQRILPAIQQVITGSETALRIRAVESLESEQVLYAVPMLTLAAQVAAQQVRNAALTTLGRIDSETAKIVGATAPTLVSRVVEKA